MKLLLWVGITASIWCLLCIVIVGMLNGFHKNKDTRRKKRDKKVL